MARWIVRKSTQWLVLAFRWIERCMQFAAACRSVLVTWQPRIPMICYTYIHFERCGDFIRCFARNKNKIKVNRWDNNEVSALNSCQLSTAELYAYITAFDSTVNYSDSSTGSGALWRACLCVCLFVSVCPRAYLQNHTSDLHHCCPCFLRQQLVSLLAALRCVMCFRFYGWRHICFSIDELWMITYSGHRTPVEVWSTQAHLTHYPRQGWDIQANKRLLGL